MISVDINQCHLNINVKDDAMHIHNLTGMHACIHSPSLHHLFSCIRQCVHLSRIIFCFALLYKLHILTLFCFCFCICFVLFCNVLLYFVLNHSEKITVSSFCRRRLPVVMVRLKMAETLREAVTFVEQGHIRVGPETISDPAFLVTRTMEDLVTWVDTSKIKRTISRYNDKLDDYTLLGN
jgi:hypothetical protein